MAGKVVEYFTVASNELHRVNEEVNRLLDDGWKLYGSPYATEYFIFQAMVREVQDEEVTYP